MEKNKFSIIELLIDPMNFLHGVDYISLVEQPAIEVDFVHFHKEYNMSFSILDEEKRIVVGPALIPNKMILRKQNEEYFYVYFSEHTIKETAKRFLKFGHQNNSTMDHSMKLEGISVMETWIIEDPKHDKSTLYGFTDLPKGTWMLSSYIDNDDAWEAIKNGTVKGYSIEGNYTNQITAEQEEETLQELEGSPDELEVYKKIIDLLESIDDDEI